MASLRADRRREGPELLGDLRRVALRDGPSRGRIKDERALPRDQRLVVRRVVPRIDALREERHGALEPVEHGLCRLAPDRDVTLFVHQLRAVAVEDRADPLYRVARRAHRHAEGMTGLLRLPGGLGEELPVPLVGQLLVGRRAGRIHLRDVEADDLFHQIDARAGRRQRAAIGGRHRDPMPVLLPEIFGAGIDRPVLLDELGHDIVDRFEVRGMARRVPRRQLHDVVPGPGLRLGGGGQQILVAVRGDEIDRDVDLFLVGPFAAELFQGAVSARHPMIPEPDRQPSRGMRPMDEWRHKRHRHDARCRALQYPPPCRIHPRLHHQSFTAAQQPSNFLTTETQRAQR